MVPVPILSRNAQSSRLLYAFVNVVSYYVPHFLHRDHLHARSETGSFDKHNVRDIVFAALIPILVLSSGLFAGLTLGYMSLDETQLNVLSISGTPTQRMYANKIKPVRKNGHLLLVTLLLANMVVNETLPIISDPVLGGGVQSVVVSTVLIVIFSEIIPQSLFTRHGLYLGAKMAGFTQLLIYALLLGLSLSYWNLYLDLITVSYIAEQLKELIAMHSSHAAHGGDLKMDTVTIIGATLDLQEKVVKQAMTPIDDVFMLSIDSRLDYDLLKKICETGHSRVPVYEEIDVPVYTASGDATEGKERTHRVKRILGILLVKHCVLLDPKDATPLRKIPLNKVPFVPSNEPLLRILDKFQEGRSHMAIVSRFSVDKAASVKQAVKRGLTKRLLDKVGMGDSDESPTELSSDDSAGVGEGIRLRSKYRFRRKKRGSAKGSGDASSEDGNGTMTNGEGAFDKARDSESGGIRGNANTQEPKPNTSPKGTETERIEGNSDVPQENSNTAKKRTGIARPLMAGMGMMSMPQLEQSMPADAVLSKEGAAEFMRNFDLAVAPVGIITLEDVLEELIGEEIYDEFDAQGAHGDPYELPHIQIISEKSEDQEKSTCMPGDIELQTSTVGPHVDAPVPAASGRMTFAGLQIPKPLKALDIFSLRSHSAPPVPRESDVSMNRDVIEKQPVDIQAVAAVANDTSFAVPKPTPNIIDRMQNGTPSETTGNYEENKQDDVMTDHTAMAPVLSVGHRASSYGMPAISDVQIKGTAIGGVAGQLSPPSRSTSPAPSLEAILLERKRRLQGRGSNASGGLIPGGDNRSLTGPAPRLPSSTAAGATGRVVPVIGNIGTNKVKGARFKSSPLGPVELADGSDKQPTSEHTNEVEEGTNDETLHDGHAEKNSGML